MKKWFRDKNRKKASITVAAALVVFVTTYSLILPALTVEKQTAAEAGIVLEQDAGNGTENVAASAEKNTDAEALQNTVAPAEAGDGNERSVEDTNAADADVRKNVATDTSDNESATAEAVADELAMPAQDFEKELKEEKITVYVKAEEGALPAGTEMEVKSVSDKETIDKITETAEKEIDGNTQISDIQAVDITFLYDGEEIEPAKDICVTISSEMIKETDEQVIVHVNDEDSDKVKDSEKGKAEVVKALNEKELKQKDITPEDNQLVFETGQFSVYAVVYTVDFHWEVDGNIYDFSIPGGGFVSLAELVEVLGIANSDNTGAENGAEAAETAATDAVNDAALTLDGIKISGKTRKFVEGVERVEFSSPELVWVGKVDQDTTVGALKNEQKLNVEYSAELSEKQIDQINTTKVESGDWALISLKAFMTSEALTITMKNGDVFTIRVTDATAADPLGLAGQTFIIARNGNGMQANANGGTLSAGNLGNTASDTYKWTFVYDEEAFGSEEAGYTAGYYLYSVQQKKYLKVDANGNFSFAETKEVTKNGKTVIVPDATPFKIKFDQEKQTTSSDNKKKGGYQLSMAETGNSKFLTYGASGFSISNNNNDNTWMGLQKPEDPSKPGIIGAWDVKNDGIVIKMFDYTATVDNTDVDKVWGGNKTEAQYRQGTGINAGRSLLFTGSGQSGASGTSVSHANQFTGEWDIVQKDPYYDMWRNLNYRNSYYSKYADFDILQDQLGKDKFPVLREIADDAYADKTDKGSLAYLFDEKKAADGTMTAYTGEDGKGLKGLLRKDEKGYYYYDAEQTYARMSSDNSEILLYSDTYEKDKATDGIDRKSKIGFFPFTDYNSTKGEEKTPNSATNPYYNHQFGMSMEATFVYPPDGKLPTTGENMVFNFSGDDDLWVFIDGVLMLDIGGVHQPVSGTLDFNAMNSSVTGYKWNDSQGKYVRDANHERSFDIKTRYKEVTGKDFDDSPYSTHEIKMFYLERGGCDSNLELSFNLMICKSLTIAKKLNGLTPAERQKYMEDQFLYELAFRHDKNVGVSLDRDDEDSIWDDDANWRSGFTNYSTGDTENTNPVKNHTTYFSNDTSKGNNGVIEGYPIKDGQVWLKAGESMTIDQLPRYDIFYVAEEDLLDMNQFETPHAERLYKVVNDSNQHEEEIHLHDAQSQTDGDHDGNLHDWETKPYALEDTDRVVYTNTIQEKNLEVKKEWKDNEAEHPEIQFELLATVDGQPYSTATGHSTINAQWTETKNGTTTTTTEDVVKEGKKYTLSKENNWTIDFEHLPKMTESATDEGKEIIYSVREVVPEGYSVTYEGPNATDLAYLDLYKFWPDDNSNHDGSTAVKKAEHIYTYVKRSDGTYIKATRDKNGEYVYAGTTSDIKEATQFLLTAKSQLQGNTSYHTSMSTSDQYEMFDYAARIRDVPLTGKEGEKTVRYTYTWDEEVDEDKTTTGLVMFTRPEDEIRILNSKGSITVEKQWKDETWEKGQTGHDLEEHPASIKYNVYQYQHTHKWKEQSVVEATEDEEGTITYVCEYDASHTRTESIPKGTHVHSEKCLTKIDSKAPTCEEAGNAAYYKCSKDGSLFLDAAAAQPTTETAVVVAALGHEWIKDSSKPDVAATCETDGKSYYVCKHDSSHTKEETVSAPGHDWGDWKVTKDPTATTEGTKERTCSRCGQKQTETIEVLKNVFPHTEDLILVDAESVWPEKWFDSHSGNFKLQPSGVFLYGDKYYVITATQEVNKSQVDGGPANCQAAGWGSLILPLQTDKILSDSDFNKNNGTQKDNLIKGDIYKDSAGNYYAFLGSGWGNKPSVSSHDGWYKIPASASASNSPAASQSASKSSVQPLKAIKNLMIGAPVKNAGDNAGNPEGDGDPTGDTGSRTVPVKNLTEKELLEALGLEALDQPDEYGNKLVKYTTTAAELQTPENADDTPEDEKVYTWSANIPVALGTGDTEYTYYVVETDPAAGGEYTTYYDGQESGLRDQGKVTIYNQKTPVSLTVNKVWTDSDTVDHENDKITYKLYRIPQDKTTDPVTEYMPELVFGTDDNGDAINLAPLAEGYTGELTFNEDSAKSWTETIKYLPKSGYVEVEDTETKEKTQKPVTYKYYVSEDAYTLADKKSNGYKITTHGQTDADGNSTVTITNEPADEFDKKTEINVEKVWEDAKGQKEQTQHDSDTITFSLEQSKYKLNNGSKDLYPVRIELLEGPGNNRKVSDMSTVVYVSAGERLTVTAKYGTYNPIRSRHTVRGNGFRYEDNITKIASSTSSPTFTTGAIDAAETVTLSLGNDDDKWAEGDYGTWTIRCSSNAITESQLISKVNTDKSLGTQTYKYSMKVEQYVDEDETSKVRTVITRVTGDSGKGEGSKDSRWNGKVTDLPLIEKDQSDNSYYIYTYKLTEVNIGTDEVDPTSVTVGGVTYDGQSSNYYVKWAESPAGSGKWTITNRKKDKVDITIKKKKLSDLENDSAALLPGATFTLTKFKEGFQEKDDSWGTEGSVTVEDAITTTGEDGETSTTEDGLFAFTGLSDGYYILEETVTPNGYVKTVEAIRLQIKDQKIILLDADGKAVEGNKTDVVKVENTSVAVVIVGNEPGEELPSTGGSGTLPYTLSGIALIALAASMYGFRMRRGERRLK